MPQKQTEVQAGREVQAEALSDVLMHLNILIIKYYQYPKYTI